MEGNHENILLEPQVQAVAEQLGKCLSDAQQEFSCDRIGN
jgi:hypothetical protein